MGAGRGGGAAAAVASGSFPGELSAPIALVTAASFSRAAAGRRRRGLVLRRGALSGCEGVGRAGLLSRCLLTRRACFPPLGEAVVRHGSLCTS